MFLMNGQYKSFYNIIHKKITLIIKCKINIIKVNKLLVYYNL